MVAAEKDEVRCPSSPAMLLILAKNTMLTCNVLVIKEYLWV
jgi:hypothetical protein